MMDEDILKQINLSDDFEQEAAYTNMSALDVIYEEVNKIVRDTKNEDLKFLMPEENEDINIHTIGDKDHYHFHRSLNNPVIDALIVINIDVYFKPKE